MQVQMLNPQVLQSLPSRASAPASSPAPATADRFEAQGKDPITFAFPSSVGQTEEEPQKLPDEAPPALARPVLFVHGYMGAPDNWGNFKDWLTRDGINPFGGIVKGDGSTSADPQGKVFAMAFSRPYNSVTTNARELRVAAEQICRRTGASEIDVVAHSKGGLDSRLYIDQGNEKVKHLVMIATPNHGTVLADLELKFRDMGLPLFPPIHDPDVTQALHDLAADRVENGKINNPLVHTLNQNLERQKARAEMLVVDGNGVATLADRTLLTLRGDGVVARASADLPGVETRHKWWTTHTAVKGHPDTLRMAAAFLTDQALPMDDPEPPDVPDDREIVPSRISADPESVEYILAG